MKITCSLCGKTDNPSRFIEDFASLMQEKHLCFQCALWTQHLERDKSRDFAIIEGHHYVLAPHSNGNSFTTGFGGHKFRIRFHDGREVTCDNLWHQGIIPENFRDRMPDNAEFITPAL